MVIGIYGPWGSGKTTLMEAVIQRRVGAGRPRHRRPAIPLGR
ncbi:MAG: hypothetical protein KJP23_06720 [Deltaproteobacteria bacterium]|nr:hypothetical protein [Deltaproteobacteria bacterium]